MPRKMDEDTTAGIRLLRLFMKLMMDGKRHYQSDLARWLRCSPQTIIRMTAEIESVIGINLKSGTENRRRYYQVNAINRNRLGLDFEEIRYLSICRDLASAVLPHDVVLRVDESIFNLSMLLADQENDARKNVQKRQLAFFPKGRIDYSPHRHIIEKLIQASGERLICLAVYRAAGCETPREHHFAPGEIICQNNTLYVLGAILDDLSPKHFVNLAVHRIKNLILTDRHFEFDMPEAEPATFGLPWHDPKNFRVKFDATCADYVRERIWAENQSLHDDGHGGVVLEISVSSEPELRSWISSFGHHAEIIEAENNTVKGIAS